VTLVLAHRGSRLREPENTVSACARALSEGADGVEIDVHRTADDDLVVCHDAASPAGVVSEMTRAEIQRAFPLVPTLAECLDACAGSLVNVEIKNLPGDADWDPTDHAAELVVELLASRQASGSAPGKGGREARVVVSSFNLATIDRVRVLAGEIDDGIETALLSDGNFDPLEALVVAEQHGHAGLHPWVGRLGGRVAGALAMRARERGVALRPWTVNDPAEIARLGGLGYDAVISDDPLVAIAALRG
jgi:glycerophosphoryl diester phosphodiesterase